MALGWNARRRLVRMLRAEPGRTLAASMLRFRVQRWALGLPQWGARAPLRITILSDLHWGAAPMHPARMPLIKARAMATAPDMILFLGDLAGGHNKARAMANVAHGAKALHGLSAPLGQYAILGNHDWHDDPAAQERRDGPVAAVALLEEAGFTVLQNAACRPGRDDVWLAGVDSQQAIRRKTRSEPRRTGKDDLARTLADAPGEDPIILLAHEPDIFPDLTDDRICLTLSGHTHAGQIRPFGAPWYVPSRHGTRYAYGHYQHGNRQLVVSAGLGTSGIPLRINTQPEITVIDIVGAAPSGPDAPG